MSRLFHSITTNEEQPVTGFQQNEKLIRALWDDRSKYINRNTGKEKIANELGEKANQAELKAVQIKKLNNEAKKYGLQLEQITLDQLNAEIDNAYKKALSMQDKETETQVQSTTDLYAMAQQAAEAVQRYEGLKQLKKTFMQAIQQGIYTPGTTVESVQNTANEQRQIAQYAHDLCLKNERILQAINEAVDLLRKKDLPVEDIGIIVTGMAINVMASIAEKQVDTAKNAYLSVPENYQKPLCRRYGYLAHYNADFYNRNFRLGISQQDLPHTYQALTTLGYNPFGVDTHSTWHSDNAFTTLPLIIISLSSVLNSGLCNSHLSSEAKGHLSIATEILREIDLMKEISEEEVDVLKTFAIGCLFYTYAYDNSRAAGYTHRRDPKKPQDFKFPEYPITLTELCQRTSVDLENKETPNDYLQKLCELTFSADAEDYQSCLSLAHKMRRIGLDILAMDPSDLEKIVNTRHIPNALQLLLQDEINMENLGAFVSKYTALGGRTTIIPQIFNELQPEEVKRGKEEEEERSSEEEEPLERLSAMKG